ncbi:MAG: aspartate-semialdehyde dehydrogenase, partial [Candidatus Methylomirabilota bacterium]
MARRTFTVAVAGATGAVGETMLRLLDERNFPIRRLKLLASERSAGTSLTFRGEEIKVERLGEDSFEGIEIALFSAGASRSRVFASAAARAGAAVIDNSSAFRMDPDVPLVIPEI